MGTDLAPYVKAIQGAKARFVTISGASRQYDVEAIFAMQALMKTDFAMQTANKNPQSVKLAMINVASTGLTLNPANGYAYLVPRDGQIVLDISYKGLIKIATDTGSVEWVRADLVHEADEFTYNGPAAMPSHKANPFKERGQPIGVYCIAKTHGGDVLTEVMDMAELEKIRGKSLAYVKKKSGPWVEWFDQMAKKAIIKRASKTWPYTEKHGRLAEAIEMANEAEGGYDLESQEEKLARRKQVHDAAFAKHWESVAWIKKALESDEPDMHGVAEAWGEIPQDDQMALWLAPTKGGCFTTKERDAIKSGVPKVSASEHDNEEAS